MITNNPHNYDHENGGQGARTGHERADAAMVGRAIRERWPIPEEYRAPIVNRIVRIVVDPSSSNREATSAARCLATMDSQNVAAPPMVAIQNNVGMTPQQIQDALEQNPDYIAWKLSQLDEQVRSNGKHHKPRSLGSSD